MTWLPRVDYWQVLVVTKTSAPPMAPARFEKMSSVLPVGVGRIDRSGLVSADGVQHCIHRHRHAPGLFDRETSGSPQIEAADARGRVDEKKTSSWLGLNVNAVSR
jgi:hypothetical protein